MCTGFEIAALALGTVAAGVSTVQGMSAASEQKKAAADTRARADAETKRLADQQAAEQAKANRKNANIAAQALAAKTPGASQTLLTGPQGVDPAKLTLGKTTALGG